MTKSVLRITRTKAKTRARVGIAFDFHTDDPQAEKIFRGIGMCLKEALTPKEADELLRKFEAARKKLAAAGDPACKLCHGSGKVDRGNGTTKVCQCRRKSGGAL